MIKSLNSSRIDYKIENKMASFVAFTEALEVVGSIVDSDTVDTNHKDKIHIVSGGQDVTMRSRFRDKRTSEVRMKEGICLNENKKREYIRNPYSIAHKDNGVSKNTPKRRRLKNFNNKRMS